MQNFFTEYWLQQARKNQYGVVNLDYLKSKRVPFDLADELLPVLLESNHEKEFERIVKWVMDSSDGLLESYGECYLMEGVLSGDERDAPDYVPYYGTMTLYRNLSKLIMSSSFSKRKKTCYSGGIQTCGSD
jgi:hypothetical protein